MTNPTPRFGLNTIVLGSDNVDVVNDFNANWTILDLKLGSQVCTSSTRPASPVQGMIIFETNTGLTRKWTGSAWQTVGNAVTLSSARPANPITGDELYETDTGGQRVYNGTTWGGNISVSTSAALPANPIQGDFTYLSDIGATAYYTGGAWHTTNLIISVSTSRPTGSALQIGTFIFETDTKRLMVWNGTAWENHSGAYVCTSTTRPAVAGAGLEIFETDTGMHAVYTGSFWSYADGQLATQQSVSAGASFTFSGIPAVKRVLLYWRARLSATSFTDLEMQLDGSSASVYAWSKLSGRAAAATVTDSGGATTFGKIGVVGGTTTNYYSNGFIVIDGWNSSNGFCTWTAISNTWDGPTSYWCEQYNGIFAVVGPHSSIKLMPLTGNFSGEFSIYGTM